MWQTHAAIGASTVWLLVPLISPDDPSIVAVLVACAVAGALMPDLDAVESKIKHVRVGATKPMVPIARAFNRDFGHRGLLHSLRGWMVWTVLILPLYVVLGWLPVAALSLGYLSHLAGDACTRSGIPLLCPQLRRYHLLPRPCRFVTGSQAEEVVFVTFALLSIALILT